MHRRICPAPVFGRSVKSFCPLYLSCPAVKLPYIRLVAPVSRLPAIGLVCGVKEYRIVAWAFLNNHACVAVAIGIDGVFKRHIIKVNALQHTAVIGKHSILMPCGDRTFYAVPARIIIVRIARKMISVLYQPVRLDSYSACVLIKAGI